MTTSREISLIDVRRAAIRQFLRRDKTPVMILVLAALVGTLVSLVGVAFEKGVSALQALRLETVTQWAPAEWRWPLAFLLSGLMAAGGYYLVRRFAPEAGGSGIPEIEGALEDLRPVRWWRVLPVKFFGGLGTLGAGMVLGREGPTVQLGGNVGGMIADLLSAKRADVRHSLLATGAAAGLSAAFNAPLTGIVLVLEMTDNYQLILPMIITCLGATLMAQFLGGQPLYSAILARTLQRQNALEQRAENEHKAKP
ncbi:chloride channel protein [Candidatus Symbiopectobacterium sp. 'North America']|uniref:chloride channel protein n=1 Tax=Candidatus Symbiopectobacterium sp. 'North America' TaxID=2794574 RepID=UPI001FD43B39|nr:chloride channel protein [Candidatus Symbiopectobacterium sp. 'North America']